MRPIWTGSISFGLVSIPVKLYSAIKHQSVKFKLLHQKDNSQIKYKRFCEEEEKEVSWDEIVKGIEITKGEFVTLTKEEIEKLKPAKSENIDVIEFIDSLQIDPIYFNNHYYLAPQKEKEKAFFLLKEVLQSASKIAVVRFIMREKEYIAVISSYKSGLLLSTLNYSYEIRNINEIEELKESPELKKEELELAKQLINKLYKETFEVSKFKDTFIEQLKDKIKGKEAPIVKKRKKKNLVEALKASLK